jgi:hypothetical protein
MQIQMHASKALIVLAKLASVEMMGGQMRGGREGAETFGASGGMGCGQELMLPLA